MSEEWQIVEKYSHPLGDGQWVKVIARIRKNETGEIRNYETHEILGTDEGEPSDFNWSANNFSCDCNRYLFFQRAAGEDESGQRGCGEDGYSVQLINPATGRIYYDEFEDT